MEAVLKHIPTLLLLGAVIFNSSFATPLGLSHQDVMDEGSGEQVTTEAQIGQTTEAPKNTTEGQKVTTEAPKVTTEEPNPTTEAPKATTEAPKVTTEAPKATTEAPNVTTEAPKATTEAQNVTSEAAKATTEAQNVTSEAPKATTEAQVTTEAQQVTTTTTEKPLSRTYNCSDNDHFGPGYYTDVTLGCRTFHYCGAGQETVQSIACYGELVAHLEPQAGSGADMCWPVCDYPENVECAVQANYRLAPVGSKCVLIYNLRPFLL